MPQDPNLYGQKANKKQKKDSNLSSSLDFTAQLTSLLSTSQKPSSSGRPRPSKERKQDLFKKKTGSDPNGKSSETPRQDGLVLKDVGDTEEESKELARARRRMEEKARLYAAMKRGDYVAKENEAAPLVDFDRKWAEEVEGTGAASSSSDDSSDADEPAADTLVEYEDEFGRQRKGTIAEKERFERQQQRGLQSAIALNEMAARPSAPQNLIYGDTIQAMAFTPSGDVEKMEALARKRDRSATPPSQTHYDADWEIRTKGTGFYKFSKDEVEREKEMKELDEEREKTERERQEREAEREKRRRDVEERRKAMEGRRAKKQADTFLDRL